RTPSFDIRSYRHRPDPTLTPPRRASDLEHGHAALARVAVPVVGQVKGATAAEIEGGDVVLRHLDRRCGPQPAEEASERLPRGPRRAASRGGVEVVEPVEQRLRRVLQQQRRQLVRTDAGHDVPRSGNRCGELPTPSQPSRLNRTFPSLSRKVWLSPASPAGWKDSTEAPGGPVPPMPGPPSVSRLQNICSCWALSRPASSACAGGTTYRS